MTSTPLPSYLLGSLSLIGALMGYINKGSIPSLLAGGSVSAIFFVGGALITKGSPYGLVTSLVASVILLTAGLSRCVATSFQKTFPLALAALGLVSTLYFGSFFV